jgi:hypothetical protein
MDIDKVAGPASHATHSASESAAATEVHDVDMPPTVNMRTPKRKSSIYPPSSEMHPAHHQASCSKPLEEARWLGFQKMEPRTEPTRKNPSLVGLQETPTKLKDEETKLTVSPGFQFSFRQPSVDLSPAAKQMMAESRNEAAKIRAQMIANGEGPTDPFTTRKIAKPKGKSGRFSDIHERSFKKMDSIANHASAFRADPSRAKPAPATPVNKSLKRTRSKADLDTTEESSKSSKTSKPQSMAPPASNSNASTKRNKREHVDDAPTPRKLLKTPTGADNPEITARALSTIPKPPRTILHPVGSKPEETARLLSSVPKPPSSIMTPTKTSIARSQSAKNPKIGPVTSLPPSRSVRSLRSEVDNAPEVQSTPPKASAVTARRLAFDKPATEHGTPPKPSSVKIIRNVEEKPVEEARTPSRPTRLATKVGSSIKSILKGPSRLYSNDPAKIAAGTHTPISNRRAGLQVPATAPVQKHIRFTNSTIERDEQTKASTPQAISTFTKSPLSSRVVSYPAIDPSRLAEASVAPKRASIAAPSAYDFTFRSDRPITFGGRPTTPSTIRRVESLDEPGQKSSPYKPTQSSVAKRKVDAMDATPEQNKENQGRSADEGEHRSAKRIKATSTPVPRTPSKTPLSRLPRVKAQGTPTPVKTGQPRSISRSRLNMLATPKRRV